MPPAKHSLFGLPANRAIILVPLIGYAIGAWVEWKETLRMTGFRDKSALYGKPAEKRIVPSWPLVLP